MLGNNNKSSFSYKHCKDEANTLATKRLELHRNIKVIKIDPTLKNATPYWIIIAAGSMEKGRAVMFKYIDNSKLLTKEEKAELKNYPISDAEQATRDLATYSHQYADTIVWTIFQNPDTWQNDQNIKNITENCLLETAKYVLGLVKYVVG